MATQETSTVDSYKCRTSPADIDEYFAVREGIPVLQALKKVSAMLAVAGDLADELSHIARSSAPCGVGHMIWQAKALLDAVVTEAPMFLTSDDQGR